MHRRRRERDVRARANVLMQQRPEIHPVKLIAAQDEKIIERLLEKITHVLPHRVGCSLVPLRSGRRLLRGQNIDKAARKIVELIARLNMAMQRHAVELREHIN